ncbi:phosphoribosyltransferase [Bacillus sp. BRMEA1]|uniref:phosphoribosyltransferase n=1 Tax=Neobacillus endophyticus TaxID=2738405 RepID=UPI0015676DD7|nr:phosphoribosyltransferase [Neobacillus endophyticus]NRD79802.1 phosphoribosyltransferase [Neobacillus endophyticus]
MFTYLSYDDIAFRIDAMIEDVRKQKFSSLVVIVRGGTFPGIHLSVRTGIPIYYLNYERDSKKQASKISWIGSAPPIGKTLLCEDMAGSGKTLIESRQFIEERGFEVQSFVVYKDTYSASIPEFFCFSTNDPEERFVVPWEKEKFNPKSTFTSDKPLLDHEYEFTGWDMDGIFLADVPKEYYLKNTEQALLMRDEYPISSNRPILREHDVIITGRPIEDKERTHVWLNRNNVFHPVYFRDNGKMNPTALSTAMWKGRKAVEIGCLRYVESDVEQAIFISKNFPHLEVVWWNNANPISIKASSFSKIS